MNKQIKHNFKYKSWGKINIRITYLITAVIVESFSNHSLVLYSCFFLSHSKNNPLLLAREPAPTFRFQYGLDSSRSLAKHSLRENHPLCAQGTLSKVVLNSLQTALHRVFIRVEIFNFRTKKKKKTIDDVVFSRAPGQKFF